MSAPDERLLSLGLAGLGLAHELSSPLTTLGLSLELLAEQLQAGELDPAAAAAELQRAVKRIQRMGALIDRFRHFARGTPGRPEPTAVDALLDEVSDLLRPALTELAAARLHRGPPQPKATVLVDPLLMSQAIACLVLNAVDAVRDRPDARVTLGARPWSEGRIGIVVEDEGAGFDAPQQATHLGHSTKGAGGMGVGLALASEIATRSGGALEVSNRPEGGACVALVLPFT